MLHEFLADSWIRRWRRFPELSSTNDAALRLLGEEPGPDPLLILADRQTAGRGRGSHAWWSTVGALTCSLIVDPLRWSLDRAFWPRLSVAVGGAVAETVAPWLAGRRVQLKWPNDVYLDGRKLCGILVETSPQAPERLVIGIGINVENSLADAPPELAALAISMIDAVSPAPSRCEVLKALLGRLDDDLHQLSRDPGALLAKWRSRCFLTGKTVSVSDVERTTSGTCLGLEDDASLLIQTEGGPRRCYAGEVSVLD